MQLDSSLPRYSRYAYKAYRVERLKTINKFSKTGITGEVPVTLSITSFGERLKIVGYAIESIAQGSVRPKRFILWVDDESFDVCQYPMLANLVSRGLEIRYTKNYGPHNKSYPFASTTGGLLGPLVTADDDFMYPRDWLERLYRGHVRNQNCFVGFRGHHIRLDGEGNVLPYTTWHASSANAEPSYRCFLTGVGGLLFTPSHLEGLAEHGEEFMDKCPRADDIWINVIANRLEIPGKVLDSRGMFLLPFPKSQRTGLQKANVEGEQNDAQLKATLIQEDLIRLRSAV